MSGTLEVPRRQGSPTTIRSSGCEAPSYQNWPLYDERNAHHVSPSDHYFKAGNFHPYDAPFDFDDHSYIDEKAEYYEHFPTELPEKPPRPFFRSIPFIPGYEIPIRPQIRRARKHIKNPIPLSWRTGIQRLYESWVDNWWLWELLSWVVSAVCMGVIALILLLSENRAAPNSEVTLNSMIAVLSGVAKAALLLPTAECLGQMKWSWFWRDTKKVEDFETFDMASRGPWGSLMLLWRTKGRTIAAFGALITIVSVAVDPFFQQLVIFPQRWVPTPVNGTIPQAVNYTGSFPNVTKAGDPIAVPDAVMRAFVQPYIFGDDLEPEIPLSCPTSNCTWDVYDTLSVCSTCTDISSLLAWTCIDDLPVDWLSNVTDPTNTTQLIKARTCGWFVNETSSDPVLMTGYMPTMDPEADGLEVLVSRVFPMFDTTALISGDPITTYFDGSVNFKDIENPLLDFFAVSTPGGVAGVYANTTPIAQECAISWCVKRARSQVYIGNLTHEVIGQPMQPKGSVPSPWSWNEEDNNDYSGDFTYSPPGSNETFRVSNDTTFQTIALLSVYFPLTITGSTHFSDFLYRFSALQPDAPYVRDVPINAWAEDIVGRVDGLSRIMSNVLMTSFQGVRNIEGTAWASEVFVSVRWKWFSLPFALLLLSLVFLLSTIFKSAEEEQDIGIWKTSALPVLMNGLRGDVRRRMGTSTKMGNVRTRARDVEMKLQYGKKGYRLSNVPGSVWTSSPEQNSRAWI